MKKLRQAEVGVQRLFDRIRGLGHTLGPIVFQLPPDWHVNEGRLADFLNILPRRRRYAFEFRDASWNTPAIYKLLAKHNAALCIFHLAGVQSPLMLTADFTYVRLHGPGGKYQGSYDDRALGAWAKTLREWNLPTSYVYFDNDQSAYAAKNAIRMRQILNIE